MCGVEVYKRQIRENRLNGARWEYMTLKIRIDLIKQYNMMVKPIDDFLSHALVYNMRCKY